MKNPRGWQRLFFALHLFATLSLSFNLRVFPGFARCHRYQKLDRFVSCKPGESNLSRGSSLSALLVADTTVDLDTMSTVEFSAVPLLVIVAIGLGFTAQGWINRQLEGDQGLGAFLQDGKGFKKSGFRPLADDADRAASSDTLPWLKLPKLDFVEVAGQKSSQDQLFDELEDLRVKMNQQLQLGNIDEARTIRMKLESLMRENGIEFLADE